VILAAVGLVFTVGVLLFARGESAKKLEKFFKTLDKKFDMALVNDRSDIIILRDSIAREVDATYSLAPLLEDYLKYLIVSAPDGQDNTRIKARYDLVKAIVDEETKEKPFADMPEEERRLLRSLKDAVDHNDKQSITFNLDELSSLISARGRVFSRVNKLNRWSIPLAIIGLVTTILFGIMSIRQSIDYDKLAKSVALQLSKAAQETKK
jgi:hypothetical protein